MDSINRVENSDKPTVAHFTSAYLFSHGTWVYNQIRYLESWRPIVLCGKTENLSVFPFDPIYSLQSLAKSTQLTHRLYRRLRGYYPYFKQAMRAERAQALHAHFGPAGYGMLPLARVAKAPLVTTFYGYDLSRLPQKSSPDWRGRYAQLFAEGDMFLLEGPYMRQQLIALGCPPEKAHVQRLGIDLSRLPFAPRKASSDGCVRVLAAATFTEKKGLVYAVEAFGHLCQTHKQVRLTIIGDARNRPDEQATKREIQRLVVQYGIEDKVAFLGYQPYEALIKQFYEHHIFISPSVQAADGDNEGGAPVTIIEALASGLPVVSTTHCDIPSVVEDGKSGYLVAERDVPALVEALTKLVESPEQWEVMGRNGRVHIEEHYNALHTARELEKKYNVLFSG